MAMRQPFRQQRGGIEPPRHRHGADKRLQLRQALAELQSPDLATQAQFAVDMLLREADAGLLDFFLTEALHVGDCPAAARRLRYKLAANALYHHAPPDWSTTLLHARDRLVERVGAEDNGGAAAELQTVARQLTAAFVEAYCHGQYASLGCASKAEVPRDWLSRLLIVPLLRAACRGPARTRVANACLLVHGVLLQCEQWAMSASVLHTAVDCLKQMLKLTGTGALALSAGEVLLPLQSCVVLLGPRLKAAALAGILQLCTQGMQRSEWQVRKAAADTLAVLAETLLACPTAAALAPLSAAADGGQHQQQAQQQQQEQEQGIAALESIAPAIVAVVEQYIRYDRIPQVRQAAASVLHQLQQLPGVQQEQQPPMHQLQAKPPGGSGGSIGGSRAARSCSRRPMPRADPAAPAAAHVAQVAVALGPGRSSVMASPDANGLAHGRRNLQAVIAQRRQELKASGSWRQAAAVDVYSPAIGGSRSKDKAAAVAAAAASPGGGLGRASSVGSADGDREETKDRIRAWAGAAVTAAEPPQWQKQRGQQQQELHVPGGGRGSGSRPPSADTSCTAKEALYRLQLPKQQLEGQQEARRRRPWGSQTASPTKYGGGGDRATQPAAAGWAPAAMGVPGQGFVQPAPAAAGAPACVPPQAQAQEGEQVWQENLPAHSFEGPLPGCRPAAAADAAAPPLALAALHCIHHIEHPQFSLRLQAAPAEAELRLAAGVSSHLSSMRFWAGQGGVDTGVEFALAAGVLHRYWLQQGQLRQEHQGCGMPVAAAGAGAGAAAEAVECLPVALSAEAVLPDAAHPTPAPAATASPAASLACRQQQPPLPSLPLLSGYLGTMSSLAAVDLPAESPLASLATVALPSFSPDKPTVAGAVACALGQAASPPAIGSSAAATAEQEPGSPQGRGSPSATPLPAAGVLSSRPVQQQHNTTERWAARLRPPGEQLLPGLPDWDRSSRPGSPAPKPGPAAAAIGSCSRAGSRPASPSRQRQEREQEQGRGAWLSPQQKDLSVAQQRSSPGQRFADSPCIASTASQQQQLLGIGGASQKSISMATMAAVCGGEDSLSMPGRQQQQQLLLEEQAQAQEEGDSRQSPGPLTVLVTRAVSKLQQLHELQEELALPCEPSATTFAIVGAAASASSTRGGGVDGAVFNRCQRQAEVFNPRRSLDRSLSAIAEAPLSRDEGELAGGGSSRARQRPRLPSGGSSPGSGITASASKRQRRSGEGHEGEMRRLKRLQKQLQHDMREIQWRVEQGCRSPGAASGDHLPVAWAAQDVLLLPRWGRYQQQQQQQETDEEEEEEEQQQLAGSPAARGDGSTAYYTRRSCLAPEVETAAEEGEEEHEYFKMRHPASQLLLAVSNPLYGTDRPDSAATQSMLCMVSPERTLVRPQQGQAVRQNWAGGSLGLHSPHHSTGGPSQSSFGSLGSGFGMLRRDSEAEVQQFLRGSLAVPRQQQKQQPQLQEPQHPPPLQPQPPPQRQGGRLAAALVVATQQQSGRSRNYTSSSAPAASVASSPGSTGAVAAAAAGNRRSGTAAAAARLRGSLDITAILDSRPSSPDKLPSLPYEGSGSEEGESGGDAWQTARTSGEGWHTARSGRCWRARGGDAWLSSSRSGGCAGGEASVEKLQGDTQEQSELMHSQSSRRYQEQGVADTEAAVADLQLLRISSRLASPNAAAARSRQSEASAAQRAVGSNVGLQWSGASTSGSGGALSEVVSQTFPPEAVERLQRLKAQLRSPPATSGHPQAQRGSPAAHSGAGSPMGGSAAGSGGSGGRWGSPASLEQEQQAPLLPQRAASPELPDLGISWRQAQLLQVAVGRLAGNPSAADTAGIQAALTDVLEQQTAHVQAHYQQAAAERLSWLRHWHGHDPAALQRELARHVPALEAAREAAVRAELGAYVEQVLPRLAEILSTQKLLTRCFEAAAEGEDCEHLSSQGSQ